MSDHAFIEVPEGEKWKCTDDGPLGGMCGKLAIIGCDGKGRKCLVDGDAWCVEHDPRPVTPTQPGPPARKRG